MPSFRVVFPLFPGVTQLDFTGPHQVFARVPGAEVVVASVTGEPIECDGLVFSGLSRLSDVTECDVLCVPGGLAATQAALDERFVGEVRRLGLGAPYVSAVCTGSLILAAAGLLTGKRASCHWAWIDLLDAYGIEHSSERVVRDGNTFTGGGVTAGIDLALTVVAEVVSPETAQVIQLTLEYAPAPPFEAGRPETAPEHIRETVRNRLEPLMAQRREQVALAAQRLRGDVR